MPTVWIPGLMRDLTGGKASVRVDGATVREVIENLDRAYPGARERLCEPDGRLQSFIAIAVDGEEAAEGLRTKVRPESEIHIVPAIAGG
jgi:sulfur-carrier protein